MHIPAPTSYNGNYTRFSFLHTIYTKVSISPYTPRAIDNQPKKMPIQSVTPWRGTTVSPSNSFAHMPILIFSVYWNLWRLEGLLSNLILFLSYQMDQITQPNTRPHNLFYLLLFTRPNHSIQKFVHRLWKTIEIPQRFSISIQDLKEKLHVRRIWEFDSLSRLHNGQEACWESIIPFSTRKSLV